MPPLRNYTVTQEREVKVTATNLLDAAALADRIFSNTKTPEDQINISGTIRERNMIVRED